jgi:transcriptional regulator GlxA family with amidase domain
VTMAWVAKRLGRSVPTLRRHLEDEGVTFSGVLDAVRWRRAGRLLRDTSMPIWEVAAATGFSNGATFHRAFRRATGTSPAIYRQGTRREAAWAPALTPGAASPTAWSEARVA